MNGWRLLHGTGSSWGLRTDEGQGTSMDSPHYDSTCTSHPGGEARYATVEHRSAKVMERSTLSGHHCPNSSRGVALGFSSLELRLYENSDFWGEGSMFQSTRLLSATESGSQSLPDASRAARRTMT